MAIDYKDTISLMGAIERIKPPASLLVDTFFPHVPAPAINTTILVEYRKGTRRLAPFVVDEGNHGVEMSRSGSTINLYVPPMVAPRRTITSRDIEQRGFGETIYSTRTPAQRAAEIQARDLSSLQAMIVNRKNQMAAEILTTGSYTIKGLADDAKTAKNATINFDWDNNITVTTGWDNAAATIYDDLRNASELIQENAGMVPTVAICGKNVAGYLMKNTEIMKWLAIPSRDNLSLMSIQPRITSPQVVRIGFIQSLNLELYSYAETYMNESGVATPFLDPDKVIIGIPGRGRQLHSAVTLINDAETGYSTYSGIYVPQYTASKESNTMALTVYSRFLLAPEMVDDWACLTVKTS